MVDVCVRTEQAALTRLEDGAVAASQFQIASNLCRESRKSPVWLCLVLLSFFSSSTCAVSVRQSADAQFCVKNLKPTIEQSDAMLYAPTMNNIEEKCETESLKCYIVELLMVIDEEEIENEYANCIFDFNDKLHDAHTVRCPPCEIYSPANITIFLERLNTLLERIAQSDADKT